MKARRKPKPSTIPTPLEHDEQVAVCRYLDRLGVPYFAVPNAARRSARLAAYLKAEGLKAGVPDLWLPVHRIAIEMKRRNATLSATSKEQAEWIALLQAYGWRARVCRGASEAVAWLRDLGVGPSAPCEEMVPVDEIPAWTALRKTVGA